MQSFKAEDVGAAPADDEGNDPKTSRMNRTTAFESRDSCKKDFKADAKRACRRPVTASIEVGESKSERWGRMNSRLVRRDSQISNKSLHQRSNAHASFFPPEFHF